MKFIFLLVTSTLLHATASFAQAGQLDPSFNYDGKVTTKITAFSSISSLAVQPDNKILAAGFATVLGYKNMTLVRYLPDGSLDNTFGTNGILMLTLANSEIIVKKISILPTGRILAGGYVQNGSQYDFCLVQFLQNGAIDPSFGNGGIVNARPGSDDNYANAMVVQPDGKIILAGSSGTAYNPHFAIARFLPNGHPDSSFAGTGSRLLNINSDKDEIKAAALQADGKIVVAGNSFFSGVNGGMHITLARFKPDGGIDSSFNNTGILISTHWGTDNEARAVAVQPNGKIVVAGWVSNGGFSVSRLQVDGTADNGFGTNGYVSTWFGYQSDTGNDLVLQPDGKIVVAGSEFITSYEINHFALARYLPNGSLDPTFNGSGKTATAFGPVSSDQATAVILQPDGKIVAGGFADSCVCFALARYFSGLSVSTSAPANEAYGLSVYPNPVSDQITMVFTLEEPEYLSIQLADLTGQILYTDKHSSPWDAGRHEQSMLIPASIPAGLYWLIVQGDHGRAIRKIFVR
jgi:uncharacterized delta-60 repeat protein